MRLITSCFPAPTVRRIVAAVVAVAFVTATSAPAFAQGKRPPQTFSVLPVTITDVAVANGGFVVNGLIGTNEFQVPLVLTPQQSGGACPILDLQVGAIDLTLAGLRVQTSPICLEITAMEGGGLLGDLLCEVANLLQGGTSLADVIALLEGRNDLSRFLAGLTSLLDEVFDRLTNNSALAGATCQVASLALGPIELNLLGLVVELDDCANGPVTVDITAIPGGGLLGDLLCSLTDLLNNRGSTTVAINTVLFQIARVIGQLVG
jgi:hypothetical protein